MLVRDLRTVKVMYRVNVSESFGAISPGLSRIKRLMFLRVLVPSHPASPG